MRLGTSRSLHGLAAIFTMATLFTMASCNIFTSSFKVNRMVLDEGKVLEKLRHRIEIHRDQQKAKLYKERVREAQARLPSTITSDLEHPNAVYNVIKRFVADYKAVLGDSYETFMTSVRGSDNEYVADDSDLKGARLSLLRLQSVYQMDPLDMVKGDCLGFKGPPLEPQDAYEIGKIAFGDGKLKESLQWLNASLTLLMSPEYMRNDQLDLAAAASVGVGTTGQFSTVASVGPVTGNHWKEQVGAVKALMGRIYMSKGDRAAAQAMYNDAVRDAPGYGDVKSLKTELLQGQTSFAEVPHAEVFYNFSRLCSLENGLHIPEPNNPKIVCRYREALLPYNRFKEEILSISPFASVIYNVTTDAEAEYMKNFVRNTLTRGRIGGGNANRTISDIRTSDLGWVWDRDSEKGREISERVGQLTGLDTTQRWPEGPMSSEALQVVNYGLGGHYEVHMDPLDDPSTDHTLKDSGNRIATFLIYLSDVQRGGSTVFTQADIAVGPVKNMALLWYSFNPAYEVDLNTRHAGCPVLIGQKWITNKWIWTYGNTFRRRCGLTPDATQVDIEPDMKRGYK